MTDAQAIHELVQAGLAEPASDESFDRFARLVHRQLGVASALVTLVLDDEAVLPGAHGLPDLRPAGPGGRVALRVRPAPPHLVGRRAGDARGPGVRVHVRAPAAPGASPREAHAACRARGEQAVAPAPGAVRV